MELSCKLSSTIANTIENKSASSNTCIDIKLEPEPEPEPDQQDICMAMVEDPMITEWNLVKKSMMWSLSDDSCETEQADAEVESNWEWPRVDTAATHITRKWAITEYGAEELFHSFLNTSEELQEEIHEEDQLDALSFLLEIGYTSAVAHNESLYMVTDKRGNTCVCAEI